MTNDFMNATHLRVLHASVREGTGQDNEVVRAPFVGNASDLLTGFDELLSVFGELVNTSVQKLFLGPNCRARTDGSFLQSYYRISIEVGPGRDVA